LPRLSNGSRNVQAGCGETAGAKPMIRILRTAACAALVAGLGVVTTTGAALAITLELTSSSGGVYDYASNSPSGFIIGGGQSISLTGLSGVTGASVYFGISPEFAVSITPNSVVLTERNPGQILNIRGGLFPIVEVTSSVLTSGAVDYALETFVPGDTFTGTVEGPVASPVPEASTWAMMLLGFAGLGVAALRRKSAVEAISG
jgi:hypothetical protein